MLIRRFRYPALGIAASCLLFATHELKAQFGWGNNAAPSNGPCVPAREFWGYYKTCWHRWPCGDYPQGMPTQGGPANVGTPSVDLPDPRNEAEIRIPSTSTTRDRGPMPPLQGGGMENEFRPIAPADRDFGPAPRGAPPMPRNLPRGGAEMNELEPTLPPGNPQAEPMSMNRSRPERNQNNSAPLPRFKLRSSGADNVAGREPAVIQGPRLVADEREDMPKFTAPQPRPAETMPLAPMKATSEPELLIPTNTVKPMDTIRKNVEPASTSGNPLRGDFVQPAVFEEESPAMTHEGGPSPASGAVRSNPLRR
jgi:hypothetical protein